MILNLMDFTIPEPSHFWHFFFPFAEHFKQYLNKKFIFRILSNWLDFILQKLTSNRLELGISKAIF